jgi:predicted flap endonuclease-1-like 5' DNA nuclease
MRYSLSQIHGIGPVHQAELSRLNVRNTDKLIHVVSDPVERRHIARSTGLPEKELKRWRNFAQLLRIPGIGPTWATLLSEAKVDSLVRLADSEPRALTTELQRRAERHGWKRVPSSDQVTRWVGDAKTLHRGTAAD